MEDYQIVVFRKLVILQTLAHSYHWNVSGPQFLSLHDYFEEIYKDATKHIDMLAERMVREGHIPSYVDALNAIESTSSFVISEGLEMVANYRKIVLHFLEILEDRVIPNIDSAGDEDFYIELIRHYEIVDYKLGMIEGAYSGNSDAEEV